MKKKVFFSVFLVVAIIITVIGTASCGSGKTVNLMEEYPQLKGAHVIIITLEIAGEYSPYSFEDLHSDKIMELTEKTVFNTRNKDKSSPTPGFDITFETEDKNHYKLSVGESGKVVFYDYYALYKDKEDEFTVFLEDKSGELYKYLYSCLPEEIVNKYFS